METVSTTASNGNPTSENVHEQLLSLLGELTDKLTPAPAPKPEDVLIWHTGTIQQQAFHLAQLVVLAAEGDDDLLYPLRYGVNKEGGSHE